MKIHICIAMVTCIPFVMNQLQAKCIVSVEDGLVNLAAENETYGTIFDSLRQQIELELDIPSKLKTERVPLLEIRGMNLKATLLKILEGAQYDFLLVGRHGSREAVDMLIVVGKSTKIAPTSGSAHSVSNPTGVPVNRGNPSQHLRSFNQQTKPRSGTVGQQQQMVKPTVPTASPLAPRPASPLSLEPYGRPLGNVSQELVPSPSRTGQVPSPQPETQTGTEVKVTTPSPY